MLAAIKQFFSKHLSALNDEATALNERQAIYSGIKGFLLGVFRFTIILGVCYVIMGPVFGIIANSFFSNKDAYNPMVYLLHGWLRIRSVQISVKEPAFRLRCGDDCHSGPHHYAAAVYDLPNL